ncbi:Citrate carrier [invertebrate metagenome]|uniref:Citrate carrier n=1 Tax=invertebrate metagenome TaxID=1711999 RepID=A0A2H9T715_9ZZZZ
MYDSSAEKEPRKIGAYLYWTGLTATCVTSPLFMTGLAPNLLALSIVENITDIQISWMEWLWGFLPVGLVLFLITPLVNYVLYPPSQKRSDDMPVWAEEQIRQQGPLTRKELTMALLAVLALVLWIFCGQWLSTTTASLTILCLMVLTGVVSWSDVIGHKQAWNVFVWFATLVTLAGGLAKVGFLQWIADNVGLLISGYPPLTMLVVIVICFFLLHYFFASITAHVTALLPVFLTLAMTMTVSGLSALQASLMLCFSLGLMGVITPYAAGPEPIWYGAGFISVKASGR